MRQKWMGAAAMGGLLLAVSGLGAQETAKRELPVNATMRDEVIAGVLKRLNDSYVFPDVAKKMEEAVRKRQQNREYDAVSDGFQFAELLTTHLREVSHDKHLRVLCSAEKLPVRSGPTEPTPEEREREERFLRRINYGFEKVERLPGNVGYLDFRFFMSPQQAGETAAAAMRFLADTDALILDLRQNGGGDPAMVAFLCSYFFDGEPVHLNDLYWRPTDTTQQFWTLPHVPGKRYIGKPVYVLTGRRTFSGAEECTYNLKNLKRATIVGETTGGGAHPGGTERVNDHFMVWVPSGRAINPITKDNWEGKGVVPDVAVPAENALKQAHLLALEKLVKTEKDAGLRTQMQETIANLKRELSAKKAD